MPAWSMLVVGLATASATLVGGGLVLRFRSALDPLLGFSAGTIIGVALFDLLPEALDLSGGSHQALSVTSAVGVGFLLYLTADRTSTLLLAEGGKQRHFAPASLTIHSLLDGLAIGLAFRISSATGAIVTLGVLAHDFIDGANTVTVSLSNGSASRSARLWLAADALAPLVGLALASLLSVKSFSLALLVGLFAGSFLYIGASELLPRSHAHRPRLSTTGGTAAGLLLMYLVTLATNAAAVHNSS